MTMKQKILSMLESLPEDTTIDRAIEQLCLLAAVEEGISQLDRGEGIPHEQVVAELLRKEPVHGST